MQTTALIRRRGGAEVPAPGWWRIPSSHVTVSYRARTSLLHRVRARAPSASGTLHVADDLERMALELDVGASARADVVGAPSLGELLGDEHIRRVLLRARAVQPTAHGTWRTRGEVEIDGRSQAALVIVTYHGVYRVGPDAKAWLTVHAEISHGVAGLRRRGPVELVADILAVGPPSAVAA